MGRGRKAWLVGGNGIRMDRGHRLPGFYVGYHEYRAGRVVNRSKHFDQLADARRWLRQHNARLQLGELSTIAPITLTAAAVEFDAALAARAPDTRAHYLSAIGMLAGLTNDAEVQRLRGADVDAFIAERLHVSRPATVAKHLRGLRRFFNWAQRAGYADRNPVTDATARPSDRVVADKPTISERDLSRLIAELDTPDRKLAVWIALTTGLDRSVIAQLCTAQVDLQNRVIRFTRGKTHKPNVVPLHPRLLRQLARRLDAQSPLRPILIGLAREPRARDWWHRAATAAGLPDLQFRHLRAVAASRLQRLGGATLRDAQDLLGHASILTTAAHYHMPDPATVRAFARLPLPGHPENAKPKRPTPRLVCPPASQPA